MTVDTPVRVLLKGNEAIAEAAVQAGCDAYFGYPITPQAELLEWMARRMPEEGRAFVGAESEIGAISMALGAGATGARVMVSTSSPGFSLMAEGMSYMAGSQVPCVLVNVMRGGGPGQHRARAGRLPAGGQRPRPRRLSRTGMAPASIGEAIALVADRSRSPSATDTPVILLADGVLGQAMEPVVPDYRDPPRRDAVGAERRRRARPACRPLARPAARGTRRHNDELQAKFREIETRSAGPASASTTPRS